jgi:glycosyltransferase involved in cell wall biosynthesis
VRQSVQKYSPPSDGQAAALRIRLDDAHLELQRMQDELEERQGVFRLVRSLLRRLLKEPLYRLSGYYRRSAHCEDHLLNTSTFTPYVLNYLKSPPVEGKLPVVLHAIGTFRVGGLPRLVVDIIERTSDHYEHVVVTLHNPDPPAFLGINVLELEEPPCIQSFARKMARFNPAIVHVHHYAPHSLHNVWLWYRAITLAAASLKIPLIEGVNVPMTPYYHPAVHCYVFVSHYVQVNFGFLNQPNRTIYPGSDFTLFAPKPRQFSDTIGMVYRLDESKLRKESIDVFIRVLQLRPSARALIVGDGYLLPYFKEQVAKAGLSDRFTFTGFVAYAELPEYYNRMDVFVAPIFSESFGQVTPFAMNMGIPVTAYATDALPEMLNDSSVVAPTGDVESLTRAIIGLLNDPDRASVVARRNQARAQELFSVETMVEKYAGLYAEILNPEST